MKVRQSVKPMCSKCQRVYRKRTMYIICPDNPRHKQRQIGNGDCSKNWGKVSAKACAPVKRGVPLRRMHTAATSPDVHDVLLHRAAAWGVVPVGNATFATPVVSSSSWSATLASMIRSVKGRVTPHAPAATPSPSVMAGSVPACSSPLPGSHPLTSRVRAAMQTLRSIITPIF